MLGTREELKNKQTNKKEVICSKISLTLTNIGKAKRKKSMSN